MKNQLFYMSILGITLSLSGCNSVASENDVKSIVDSAQTALDNKAFQEAVDLSTKACTLKNADGCLMLGNIYKLGNDTTKINYSNALKFYKAASEFGSIDANYELGKMYFLGQGINKNNKEAMKYFEKAALKNDAKSQFYLAYIYSILEKYNSSLSWQEKAEKNPDAINTGISLEKKYLADSENGTISIDTKAGVLKTVRIDEDDSITAIELDNNVIEKIPDYSEILNCTKFSFEFHDLIILVHRPQGTAYQDSPYNYIVYNIQNGIGIMSRMSFHIGANEGNSFISNFDKENFLLSLGDGKQIFSYNNFEAKLNGKLLPQAGYGFLDSAWVPKFKKVLGGNYSKLLENSTVEGRSFYDSKSGFIIGHAYKNGDGFNNSALYAISPDGNKIQIVLITDGKVSKYGFNKWSEAPDLLKNYANFQYEFNELPLVQ